MAGTIALQVSSRVTNDDLPGEPMVLLSADLDQTVALSSVPTHIVPTAYQAIPLGSITAPAYIVVQNLDATNYIEIGRDISAAFVPFSAVGPGEIGIVKPAAGQTLYWQANTATVNVRTVIPSA